MLHHKLRFEIVSLRLHLNECEKLNLSWVLNFYVCLSCGFECVPRYNLTYVPHSVLKNLERVYVCVVKNRSSYVFLNRCVQYHQLVNVKKMSMYSVGTDIKQSFIQTKLCNGSEFIATSFKLGTLYCKICYYCISRSFNQNFIIKKNTIID